MTISLQADAALGKHKLTVPKAPAPKKPQSQNEPETRHRVDRLRRKEPAKQQDGGNNKTDCVNPFWFSELYPNRFAP
jgi:hypothetical protein